jgi:hypothetical protein
MKKTVFFILTILFLFSSVWAQESEEKKRQEMKLEDQRRKAPSQIYWGGELGLSFGDYFAISIIPMLGYKVTPQFHVGAKIGYAYTEDKRYETKITSHNYGGSLFSRYLIYKGIYAHAEFVYWSYKYQTENLEGDRNWVPFVLLGGGYVMPVSASASLFVEVLWDVLRDDNSPYDSSSPFVKVGVGVGF